MCHFDNLINNIPHKRSNISYVLDRTIVYVNKSIDRYFKTPNVRKKHHISLCARRVVFDHIWGFKRFFFNFPIAQSAQIKTRVSYPGKNRDFPQPAHIRSHISPKTRVFPAFSPKNTIPHALHTTHAHTFIFNWPFHNDRTGFASFVSRLKNQSEQTVHSVVKFNHLMSRDNDDANDVYMRSCEMTFLTIGEMIAHRRHDMYDIVFIVNHCCDRETSCVSRSMWIIQSRMMYFSRWFVRNEPALRGFV